MKRLHYIFAAMLVLAATFTLVFVLGGYHDTKQPAPTATLVVQVAAPAPPTSIEGVVVLPDDGPAPLIAELDAARQSLWIEIYLMTDEEVLAAVFRARDRGVDVRVLLEEDPYGGSGSQQEIYDTLSAGGIEVRWDNSDRRFSHVKLVVIDERVALVMNLNLTYSALHKNRELAVITTDPAKVEHAVRIFQSDWEGKMGEIPGPLVLSPDTSRIAILGLIDQAQVSLDIYAEAITDIDFIDAVKSAIARGVRVRIVMTEASGEDLRDEPVGELLRAGAELHKISDPYIHAKLLLVDQRIGFVGSQNYTSTSMDDNREVGTTVTLPSNIDRLQRVFDHDFSAATPIEVASPSPTG